MFTSKALFSEVDCPYQSTCQLPKCLFRHAEPQTQALPDAPSNVELSFGNDDSRPVKRLKVDENKIPISNGVSTAKVVTVGEVKKALSAPQANGKSQRKHDPTGPVSPPPLRKSQLAVTPNGNSSTPFRLSLLAVSTPVAPQAEAKTPTEPPLKEEPLNPRHLKGPAPNKHGIRLKLVQMLHAEYTRLNSELKSDANDEVEKLLLSDQELITRALDVEEKAALNVSLYGNIIKSKIGLYKKMTVPQWQGERTREIAEQKAAEAALKPQPVVSNWRNPTEPPKVIVTGLSTEEELKLISRLLTPVSNLTKHGYVNVIPTEADIESAKEGIEAAKGWEVCDRCKSRFQVFPGRREEDGALETGGACHYHWGKSYTAERSASDPKGKRERRWKCCNELMGDSTGCTTADCHVFKISEVKRMASVLNFEKTPENPETKSTQPVCIDGEMGYTVYGLELIRLTATSWPNGEELFDVLVRPIGEIMDLNSRFSGVWPKDYAEAAPWDAPPAPYTPPPPPLARATPSPNPKLALAEPKRQLRKVSSPAAARALLFSYLSPETPLIGHGLENDLNAIRVIHPAIIDTALLYPHKAGLPYRNALKALMLQHLNKHVQVVVDGKMEGHDSMEDANAAGELVRYKLANEWAMMKRQGWTLVDGTFTPPASKTPVATPTGPKSGDGQMREGTPTGPRSMSGQVGAGKKRSRDETELEDGELEN